MRIKGSVFPRGKNKLARLGYFPSLILTFIKVFSPRLCHLSLENSARPAGKEEP
jgi:hypothetical protein